MASNLPDTRAPFSAPGAAPVAKPKVSMAEQIRLNKLKAE